MSREPTDPKTLQIDWALYESWLSQSDLSQAEKRQFLEALFSLITLFVDLGFALEASDQSPDQTCGQIPPELAPAAAAMLKSTDTPTDKHNTPKPCAKTQAQDERAERTTE